MDIQASREAWLFFQQICEPAANLSGISPQQGKIIIRVLDIMGREVKNNSSGVVLYQYSDGTTSRAFLQPN